MIGLFRRQARVCSVRRAESIYGAPDWPVLRRCRAGGPGRGLDANVERAIPNTPTNPAMPATATPAPPAPPRQRPRPPLGRRGRSGP